MAKAKKEIKEDKEIESEEIITDANGNQEKKITYSDGNVEIVEL